MTDSAGNSRRSAKSAQAFRTISEVAADLEVPQHVLRFWETKFDAVQPLKRGGGRRYYRPEDIGLLKAIRSLLYDEGYTIKGVQKLLRDGRLAPDGTLRDEKSPMSGDAPPATAGHAAGLSPAAAQEAGAVLHELRSLRDVLRSRPAGNPDRSA